MATRCSSRAIPGARAPGSRCARRHLQSGSRRAHLEAAAARCRPRAGTRASSRCAGSSICRRAIGCSPRSVRISAPGAWMEQLGTLGPVRRARRGGVRRLARGTDRGRHRVRRAAAHVSGKPRVHLAVGQSARRGRTGARGAGREAAASSRAGIARSASRCWALRCCRCCGDRRGSRCIRSSIAAISFVAADFAPPADMEEVLGAGRCEPERTDRAAASATARDRGERCQA